MRILIDAMGGDNAPEAIVQGAVTAAGEFGAEVVLVGREAEVRECLERCGGGKRVSVVNADEVITMEDDPSTATRRKKNSSMSLALQMLHQGEGDACVSAGSTGALLSGATLTVRRIPGIRRACFAPVVPNGERGVIIADCGANAECTAEYLLQFAYMGSFYSQEILGCDAPRVGLLNIGTEESKGTVLQKETYALLTQADVEGRLRFVGNVEPTQLLSGQVDVVVCDGFSGNVLLKSVEGTAGFLMNRLKKTLTRSTANKLAALVLRKDLGELKALLDVSEVGGTPLLGLTRPVIKAHGSSDARAIRSAVKQAIACVEADVCGRIEKNIAQMRIKNT